jgi:hypothetical protein
MPTASKNTSLVKWEERLASEATAAVATTGKDLANSISIRGGVMKYQGEKIKDNKLSVVVIDHVFLNSFYLKEFDPNAPEAPDCFALGRVEEDMVPHPNSFAIQAPTCAECPQNQYESDPKGGKGKACKNQRKLGLITEDSLTQITKADVAFLVVPPTSIRDYDKMVKETASTLKRAPMGVTLEVECHPHETKNVEVGFTVLGKVESSKHFPKNVEQGFEDLFAKKEIISKELEKPYDKKVASTKKPTSGKDRKFTKSAKTATKGASRNR